MDRPSNDRGVGAPAAAITAARLGQVGGATPSGRPTGRPRAGTGTLDGPTDLGRPLGRRGGPQRQDRDLDSGAADRLQDTEFKLAGQRRKQKPKEPNKLVLGLAMGLVVLVGLGVAYFLTRGGDETVDAEEGETAITDDSLAPETAVAQADPAAADATPVVDEPTLVFADAEAGPVLTNTPYSIDLLGQPEGTQLQVVVDDVPQGQPAARLPDLKLPPGRRTMHIDISSAAGVESTAPIEFYVIGDLPAKGWRANLSSVNIQTEGWAEAIRQYDEFVAAGHENLRIYPISDGFWNIFVPELGEDQAQAESYCESFGLAMPDACFLAYLDPAEIPALAPPAPATDQQPTDGESMEEDGTTETTIAPAEGTAPADGESMEEDPQTSTTAEAMVDEGSETTVGAGG